MLHQLTINMVVNVLLLILNIERKKITKLSIVSNNNNFIHSVEVFEIKNENDKYKTSVHDVKMISKSLDKINVNNKSKYFNLLGDKAYKTKENYNTR